MSELVAEPATATVQPGRRPRSRAFTREVWLDRLARFPLSGLTVAQFCAVEVVSVPSFYAWRRRLATEFRELDTPAQTTDNTGPRLLPVRLAPPASPLELVLPSGAVLRVSAGADEATLRHLLRLLGAQPC